MPNLITPERKAQMEADGFFVIDGFLTDGEVEGLLSAIEAYEATRRGANPDERPREVLFSQKIAERCEAIKKFAKSDAFVEITTAFLGPDTDLYFNQIVFKNPEGNATFSWHQDDAYGPVEPSPYLTIWLALTDATEENGCISVLPGSYRQGLVPHTDGSFGLSCHSLDDPDQGILVPVAKGSAICFWSTTMHKSGPNRSQSIRKAIVLQYSPLGLRHKASGMPIRSRIPIARGGLPTTD